MVDRARFMLALSLMVVTSCSALRTTPFLPAEPSGMEDSIPQAMTGLSSLSYIGGFCALAGIAALVITRGAMGMRAVIGGVGLVILNYAIARYLGWILLPVLIGTGMISLAWSYRTVKGILAQRNGNP